MIRVTASPSTITARVVKFQLENGGARMYTKIKSGFVWASQSVYPALPTVVVVVSSLLIKVRYQRATK